jgi:hypothetical protein
MIDEVTTTNIILASAAVLLLVADLRSGRIHYTRRGKHYYYAWTGGKWDWGWLRVSNPGVSRGSKSYSIWRRRMPLRYWTSIGFVALNTVGLFFMFIYSEQMSEAVSNARYELDLLLLLASFIVVLTYVLNGLGGRLALWNRRRWRKANAPAESSVQTLGLNDR